MVCNRCKMMVKEKLEKNNIIYQQIELGEVEMENGVTEAQLNQFEIDINQVGFEIIDDYKKQIIEKVKKLIIDLVHYQDELIQINLSEYLSQQINHDYAYISNLFSEVQGTTIEKYYITNRIERVKELLVYNQLSISEIAHKMGYSSVAYLSNQFKKITGFTPSYFKELKYHKRKNLDEL